MKLIIKNSKNNTEYNCISAEINSNNVSYSLFPNHQDLILHLIKAKIEIIDKDNNSFILFNNLNGILFLKNNIIELVIY